MIGFLKSKFRKIPISPAWARLLPASSRSFGPPRRWGLIRDVVPRAGGTVTEAEPAATVPRPQPRLYGRFTADPLNNFTPDKPPTCVFTLPEARLLGADGFVVTKKDCFVYDTTFWHRKHPSPHRGHYLYSRKRRWPIRRLPGTCVSLASDFAVGSYGHFIHDGLLRWHLLEKAGVNLASVDWVYLPRLETPATDALRSLLPLPRERILNYSPDFDYEADRVIATSFPGAIGTVAPGGAVFLRDLADGLRRPDGERTRVFLSRRGFSRNPTNLDETEAILREFGFAIIDPASAESVAACAQAEVVAGIDGSNMAGLAFAPAGARVVIIYPSDVPPQPYHTTMSVSGGRHLHIIMGEPPAPDAPHSYLTDFYLPPGLLRSCLETAVAG